MKEVSKDQTTGLISKGNNQTEPENDQRIKTASTSTSTSTRTKTKTVELDLSYEVEDWKILMKSSTQIFEQTIQILNITSRHQHQDPDRLISRVSTILPGSTIGKHLRHVHDYFRILLESIGSEDKILNYDNRKRNLPMETSHKVLLKEFISLRRLLVERLKDRIESRDHRDIRLFLVALTPDKLTFQTTFTRELWFVTLHSTHHFALIRSIINAETDLKIDQNFGVAPSTIIRKSIRSVAGDEVDFMNIKRLNKL